MIKITIQLLVVISLFSLFFSCSKNDLNDIRSISSNNEIEEVINGFLEKTNDTSKSLQEKKYFLSSAYNWSSKLEDGFYKRRLQTKISLEYFYLEENSLFGKSTKEILTLSNKIKDSLGIAKSLSNLGHYYNEKNLPDSSYYSYNNAIEIYKNLDLEPVDIENYGATLYNLALIQKSFKDYIGSEASIIKAINEFEKIETPNVNLYLSYNNLGIISKDLGNYDEAIKNYKKALEYAKRLDQNSEWREVQSLNNIGVVFKSQEKYDLAIETYNEALNYKNIINKHPRSKAILLDNRAYATLLTGNYDGVLTSLLEAKNIRESIDDKSGLVTNYLHIAEYYKKKQEDSIAKSYGLSAMAIAKESGLTKLLLNSFLFLTQFPDDIKSIEYAGQYINLNDSIQNLERINRDKFARIKFETEKKEQQIVEISKKNQVLIIATLILSLLSLFAYVIFRQKQRNKELLFSQKQQETNEEIYRLLLTQQAKLEEGRKLEQQRMSEELHDGVLGRLFGVRLSLDGINQRANDAFKDSRNKYIEELKNIEKEIRLISHDLGAETLTKDVAYVDVVESLIKDLCTVHKLSFEFDSNENINWEMVEDQKKVNFFRIIQESLQNIFKHARATQIQITFDYLDEEIKLVVSDNGIGFNEEKIKRGIGLKNITSRVKQMSGTVVFDSSMGNGVKVLIGIPVNVLVIAEKKKPEFSIAPG